METTTITLSSAPEFFREQVREASLHQKMSPPENVEFYLVKLLEKSIITQNIYTPPQEGFKEEPLALIYCRATQSDGSVKIELLKKLGDFSLFIAGFFPASLNRSLVGTDYYIQMGECAYSDLSVLTRQNATAEIFEELAKHFVAYVDILSEVSEKNHLDKNSDLLRHYETWIKTGSLRSQHKLSESGIIPISTMPLKNQ